MADPSALEKATLRRVSFRLLPFLMLAYLVCYIDRVNAGFAALQMNKDIGLSGTVFGLGGGIFFVGFALVGTVVLLTLGLATGDQPEPFR